jgi:hypothetical protein
MIRTKDGTWEESLDDIRACEHISCILFDLDMVLDFIQVNFFE